MLHFSPTAKMKRTVEVALRPDVSPTVAAICREAGLDRMQWYRWIKKPEFNEWWSQEITKAIGKEEWKYFKIAKIKAHEDFRYWKAMQDIISNMSGQSKANLARLKLHKDKLYL